jgi:hypothetical protein
VNGDTARVSVSVAVAPHAAFEIFTRDIDRWWRRGVKFRQAGRRGGFICVEPRVGGRLFESIDGERGPQVAHAPFIRMMGLWWGDQMTSLRETSAILDLRTEPAGATRASRGKQDSA